MNKLILIGLFLVFTCQLKFVTHLQDDPLSDKDFTITSNGLDMSKLNGIDVSFNSGTLFFKGCNSCRASYKLGNENSFSVGAWISTRMFCSFKELSRSQAIQVMYFLCFLKFRSSASQDY